MSLSPPLFFYGIFIFFRFTSFPVFIVSFILLPLYPFRTERIRTGRIGRIDTQHFLQVRFYPAEKDQIVGDQVMQLRNLSHKNALTVKDIVQAPFLLSLR